MKPNTTGLILSLTLTTGNLFISNCIFLLELYDFSFHNKKEINGRSKPLCSSELANTYLNSLFYKKKRVVLVHEVSIRGIACSA